MESEYPIEYNTAARRPFLISFNTDYILKVDIIVTANARWKGGKLSICEQMKKGDAH